MAYIRFPVEVDRRLLAERALEYLADRIPGWAPSPGDSLTIAVETFAAIAAEIGILATDTPDAIMRHFGATMVGITPREATRAQVDSTWTLTDTAGHTIPAGALVGIRDSAGALVAFEAVSDVLVPPGLGATAAGALGLIARDPGDAGSGLGGVPVLLDALAFVSSIELVGTSGGGQDAEPDADYLARLVDELRLMSPRPILARDFAVLARRVVGVERTVALDNYDAALALFGQPGAVSVAGVDASGEVLSSGVKAEVLSLLQAEREPNFRIFVIDPTYTDVAASASASALPGYTSAAVKASVEAALADYLSPARWGLPETGDPVDPWRNRTTVRYLEVAAQVDRVPGVDYVTALTIQGAAADLVLPGPVPLPRPGVITATIVAS